MILSNRERGIVFLMKELDPVSTRMSTKLLECLRFDLADSLTSHTELSTDLFERMHISSIQTESHDDDLLLTWREKIKHFIEIFFKDREIGGFLWSEILIIFDEVTESRIFLSAHRRIQ